MRFLDRALQAIAGAGLDVIDPPGVAATEIVHTLESKLRSTLGVEGSFDLVLKSLDESRPIPSVRLEGRPGELSTLLYALDIAAPERVLVSLIQQDTAFEVVRFELLDRFFDDYWMPVSESCILAPDSLDWCLYIHHEGWPVLITDLNKK